MLLKKAIASRDDVPFWGCMDFVLYNFVQFYIIYGIFVFKNKHNMFINALKYNSDKF